MTMSSLPGRLAACRTASPRAALALRCWPWHACCRSRPRPRAQPLRPTPPVDNSGHRRAAVLPAADRRDRAARRRGRHGLRDDAGRRAAHRATSSCSAAPPRSRCRPAPATRRWPPRAPGARRCPSRWRRIAAAAADPAGAEPRRRAGRAAARAARWHAGGRARRRSSARCRASSARQPTSARRPRCSRRRCSPTPATPARARPRGWPWAAPGSRPATPTKALELAAAGAGRRADGRAARCCWRWS